MLSAVGEAGRQFPEADAPGVSIREETWTRKWDQSHDRGPVGMGCIHAVSRHLQAPLSTAGDLLAWTPFAWSSVALAGGRGAAGGARGAKAGRLPRTGGDTREVRA